MSEVLEQKSKRNSASRGKLFLKSFILSFVAILWLPVLIWGSPETSVSTGWFLGLAIFIGLLVGLFVVAATMPQRKLSKGKNKKQKKPVVEECLACPFCESLRLSRMRKTIDTSMGDAIIGYAFFGAPGLLFGTGPAEVHEYLYCHDCESEFEISEALVKAEVRPRP